MTEAPKVCVCCKEHPGENFIDEFGPYCEKCHETITMQTWLE